MRMRRMLGGGIVATILVLVGATAVAAAVIYGTDGNDQLYGTPDNDRIYGRGGRDLIVGRAGRDQLEGNAGNDTIRGGNNRDYIDGGWGDDHLEGGKGIDSISGLRGNDTIIASGDGEVDWVSCGLGTDVVYLDPVDSADGSCETKILVAP